MSCTLRTRGAIALRLDTSERTVKRLADAGEIEEVYVAPRTPRIVEESVDRYVERLRGQLAEATLAA